MGRLSLGVSLLVFNLLPICLVVLFIVQGPELNNWLPHWSVLMLETSSLAAYPVGAFLLWNAVKTPAQAGVIAALLSFAGLFFLLHLAVVALAAMGGVPRAM